MRALVERACYRLSLSLGKLLRTARYSRVRIVRGEGELQVQKRRLFYAPLLIWMGGPLVRILDTGVRVLAQRDWEEREHELYRSLRRSSIRVDNDVLVLPCLPGVTLAAVLEDPALEASVRTSAIELAVIGLADLHRLGFTHGDAMAENVLVDLRAGAAHWFDFETVHDSTRAMAWRRADDVRALLATCLVRTAPEMRAGILKLILDVYADEEAARLVAASFTSVLRRPLAFHLGQAPLSFATFQEIGRLLKRRSSSRPRSAERPG